MLYQLFREVGGYRHVVLFYQGHKWLKVLDLGTLDVYKLPARERHQLKTFKARKSTARTILKNRRDCYKRFGLGYSRKAVKQALLVLR